MSLRAMIWAFDQDLPPPEKLVLLALADNAHERTGQCWPGHQLLARKTGYSVRQCKRIIQQLAAGAVPMVFVSTRRYSNGKQGTNVYTLNLAGEAILKPGDAMSPGPGDSCDRPGDICDRDRVTSATSQGDKLSPPYKEDPSIEPPKGSDQRSTKKNARASGPAAAAILSDALRILDWCNSKAHTEFRAWNLDRSPSVSLLAIVAQLEAGHAPADLRAVWARKLREWGAQAHMRQAVRPATVFGDRFAEYLAQCVEAAT